MFFNVGVEIRQILFIGALLVGFSVLRPVLTRILRSAHDNEVDWRSLTGPASYLIGSIASYRMLDRISGFWT